MKIVVYGATGNAGKEIVKELLARGHQVTGVARNIDSLKVIPGVTTQTDDLSNVDAIAAIIKGADAVVSTYAPPPDNPDALRIFEAPQHGPHLYAGLLLAVIIAIAGIRLGELFGRWMRQIYR